MMRTVPVLRIGDDLAVATGSLIDHIFTRDISGDAYELSAERFLTEPLTVEIDGEATDSAYSDHYGLRLDIKRK